MMFNGKLRQLFTAAMLAATQAMPQTVSPLVFLLPKPRVSNQYPRCSEGERVRRMGQILLGTHRVENGLTRVGQLVSRPDGKLQVRRPY
jgi:hypothetical protein